MGKGTFAVEAQGQLIMKKLLSEYVYRLTPEFCRADAAFSLEVGQPVLPIQAKFAHTKRAKPGKIRSNVVFGDSSGYSGMLLLCRNLDTVHECFAIPGCMVVGRKLSAGTHEKNKFRWAAVNDNVLPKFLHDLYVALSSRSTNFKWPSGVVVDIQSISLVNFEQICVPHNPTQRRAHIFSDTLQRALPFVEFEHPLEQNTTVDILMNGVRVQEKIGRIRNERIVFYLTKHNQPYDEGDFDLFLGHIQETSLLLLIPSSRLASEGVLRNDRCKGRTSISCYPNGRKITVGRKPNKQWTNEYLVDMSDPDLQSKLTCVLDAARCEDLPFIHLR